MCGLRAATVSRYDTLFVPSASGGPAYWRTYSMALEFAAAEGL